MGAGIQCVRGLVTRFSWKYAIKEGDQVWEDDLTGKITVVNMVQSKEDTL